MFKPLLLMLFCGLYHQASAGSVEGLALLKTLHGKVYAESTGEACSLLASRMSTQQLFTNSDYDEWLLAKAGTIVWPFSVLKSVLFNDGLPGQI